MADAVIHLTLSGGKTLRIRKLNVIAAHVANPSETTRPGQDPGPDETKIYLSSGVTMFVRESVEDALLE